MKDTKSCCLPISPAKSELERCLPGCETATLQNTSHGLEYENPFEFNKVVSKSTVQFFRDVHYTEP